LIVPDSVAGASEYPMPTARRTNKADAVIRRKGGSIETLIPTQCFSIKTPIESFSLRA
jgi:hypothetical protein